MFSRSWSFPLLPSCLPIVPPDTVQVAGNLSHHWGLSGGFPQGSEPEHDLVTTL
jgi:hypothetical protein